MLVPSYRDLPAKSSQYGLLDPTVSSPFRASRTTLALKAGLCFLRTFDISQPFQTATASLV